MAVRCTPGLLNIRDSEPLLSGGIPMIGRTKRGIVLGALMACFAAPLAHAQTGLRIYGALSNFDCYNDCGVDCDGFEIEIHGVHGSDVIHTWNYSSLGAPTVTDIGTAAAPAALVRYSSSTSRVLNGGMTHFGVTLTYYLQPGSIIRRWIPKLGSGLPPVEVPLPSHQSQVVVNAGLPNVEDRITNDTHSVIWVMPYSNKIRREVHLDELMTNNAIVQGGVPAGSGTNHDRPTKLAPGEIWVNDEVADNDDSDSKVYWFKVYADVETRSGNGGHVTHTPGNLLGTIMDASLIGALNTHPIIPASMTLSDATVYDGQSLFGTVTLDSPAPAGGTVVNLAASAGGSVPATVLVAENTRTAQFPINALPVGTNTSVTIGVETGGRSLQAAFTNLAPQAWGMSFSPLSIKGGGVTYCTVYLTGPAPEGGTLVQLSSNTLVARIQKTIVVPANHTTVTFAIRTTKVTVNTLAAIRAVAGGVAYAAGLQITP